MILDILKVYGCDGLSYLTELDRDAYWVSPDLFWVIDISTSPAFRLAGPFSSIEEAKRCAARIAKEYERLLEEQTFDLSAFKTFIKQENAKAEAEIHKLRQEYLESYTLTPITPENSKKPKNDSCEP